jgi:hypothetical protein
MTGFDPQVSVPSQGLLRVGEEPSHWPCRSACVFPALIKALRADRNELFTDVLSRFLPAGI